MDNPGYGDYDVRALEEAEEEQARAWMLSADPSQGVGSRHPTVPRFYLQRFADRNERMLVRDRATGVATVRAIKDLAIRDFYTMVNVDQELDGRLEQILSVMEGAAAALFADLMSPFRPPQRLTPEQRFTLAQFLAFQMLRGPRKRREIELLADWQVKTILGHELTKEDLLDVRVVPHPNEHLSLMSKLAQEFAPFIFERPVLRVTLDRPLLITSDEPVAVNAGDDYVKHHPDCFLTQEQIARRTQKRKKGRRRPDGFRQIVHVYPTRPAGLAIAEEIVFPLSPRTLLMLGPREAEVAYPSLALAGEEADELAESVNGMQIENAYQWIAAHPEHPSLADRELPPPGAVVAVCDGGSPMSKQLQDAPVPRTPQRLRRDWR